MRGDQLTLTAVQLIGLVDSKLIGAVHKIGMIIMQDHSKCITYEYL